MLQPLRTLLPAASSARRYATDPRQLERRSAQVEAEHESQPVELDSFIARSARTEQSGQRELIAGAARRARNDIAERQIVLADRVRRQSQAQLRNLPRDVRDERVAVRPRPGA